MRIIERPICEWYTGRVVKQVIGRSSRILKILPPNGKPGNVPIMFFLFDDADGEQTREIKLIFIRSCNDTWVDCYPDIASGEFEYFDTIQADMTVEEQKETYKLDQAYDGAHVPAIQITERKFEPFHRHEYPLIFHVYLCDPDNPNVNMRYGSRKTEIGEQAKPRGKRKITVAKQGAEK